MKRKTNKSEGMQPLITRELTEASVVLDSFMKDERNMEQIEKAGRLMAGSIQSGGKIFSCGNGGSHCDAMHFAEELTGRYRNNRRALPALAISDPSHLSCVSNDFGYEYVFSRYVEGLGKKGDVILGLSTSGHSRNVINAFHTAKQINMKTVALTGKDGGKLAEQADVEIRVPHHQYADRIQEVHIKVIHILIMIIEKLVNG